MSHQFFRARRLRENRVTRDWCRENVIDPSRLIYPVFSIEGDKIKEEIPSMPGVFHYSIDKLIHHLEEMVTLGVTSVIVFGLPPEKDAVGSGAYDEHGIVQKTITAIKKEFPSLYVISDVCLCQYTSHGHCGIIENEGINNDKSINLLAETALSHVVAGADMVAPSDMMDGRVLAIRELLDKNRYLETPIMSYSAKYCSSFYGPFREAAHSAPQFGDRRSYQMDPANGREAIRELKADRMEGADILMVKPALSYLDIISAASQSCHLPIAAYNVSGEYSMVKAAARMGWIDEKKVVLEILTSITRAGARIILTYHTPDVIRWLKEL